MTSRPGRDAANDPTSEPPGRVMRASDQDRSEAVLALTDHVAEGRLDAEEFEARMSVACSATYLHELDPLFADLPYAVTRAAVPTGAAGAAPDRSRRDAWRPEHHPGRRRPLVAPLLLLAVVATLAVLTDHLWLLIPVAWFALTAPHRRRWREHAIAARSTATAGHRRPLDR